MEENELVFFSEHSVVLSSRHLLWERKNVFTDWRKL